MSVSNLIVVIVSHISGRHVLRDTDNSNSYCVRFKNLIQFRFLQLMFVLNSYYHVKNNDQILMTGSLRFFGQNPYRCIIIINYTYKFIIKNTYKVCSLVLSMMAT